MYSSKYFNKYEDTVKIQLLNNEKRQVPKWIVVFGLVLIVVSSAFLGVSLGIAVTEQPYGLYNQSCSSRFCESKLGLKCINNVCLCNWNQAFLDKCYNLSSFNGICRQNDLCKHDEFLVCNDGFKCSCSLDRYWNAKKNRCVLRKRSNEACDGDECQSDMVCKSQICKCPNPKKLYFDGKNCKPKLAYNKSCVSSTECLDSENTKCKNNKCSCKEKEYFLLSESKCVPKLNEFDFCTLNQMCQSPMFCSIKFDCRCPGYFYYDNSTSSCNNKLLVDARCKKDHVCRQDLGLTCQNGKCLCSSFKYTWSPSSLKCKLTYQKSTCADDSDCNVSENLACQVKNPNSQFFRTCGCTKEENNENYWDGKKCTQAKTY